MSYRRHTWTLVNIIWLTLLRKCITSEEVESCTEFGICRPRVRRGKGAQQYPIVKPLVPEIPTNHLREIFTQRFLAALWEVSIESTRIVLFQGSLLEWYRDASVMYSDHDIDFAFFGDLTKRLVSMFKKLVAHPDVAPFLYAWIGEKKCPGQVPILQDRGCGGQWHFDAVSGAPGLYSSVCRETAKAGEIALAFDPFKTGGIDMVSFVALHGPDSNGYLYRFMSAQFGCHRTQLYHQMDIGLGCVFGVPAFVPINKGGSTPSQVLHDQYGYDWRMRRDWRKNDYRGHRNQAEFKWSEEGSSRLVRQHAEDPPGLHTASPKSIACDYNNSISLRINPTPDPMFHNMMSHPLEHHLKHKPAPSSTANSLMTITQFAEEGKYTAIFFHTPNGELESSDEIMARINQASKSVRSRGMQLEAVFIEGGSGSIWDRKAAKVNLANSQVSYHLASMEPPWWRLAKDSNGSMHKKFTDHFKVYDVPRVVMISPYLVVVNYDAVPRIRADEDLSDFPWTAPPSTIIAKDVPPYGEAIVTHPVYEDEISFSIR